MPRRIEDFRPTVFGQLDSNEGFMTPDNKDVRIKVCLKNGNKIAVNLATGMEEVFLHDATIIPVRFHLVITS